MISHTIYFLPKTLILQPCKKILFHSVRLLAAPEKLGEESSTLINYQEEPGVMFTVHASIL
jgi:hypothetical protein